MRFEVHQDGAALACGNEFDSFLENNDHIYPAVPPGFTPSPPLPQLTHATVSFTAEVLAPSHVRDRCGTSPQCAGAGKIDYGYAVLGAVASNTKAGQTFFYQVTLGDTRDNITCPSGDKPRNQCLPAPLSWYFSTNPFGASDTPANLGATCLGLSAVGGGATAVPVEYNLDVLPRYYHALANAPAGMDTDPNNWVLSSVYLGVGMQGDVRQTVLLGDLSVVVGLK